MRKHAKKEFWQDVQMKNEILKNELFYCEHLLDDEHNIDLINSFSVKKESGSGLERYLKQYAYRDELEHDARIYLVKDIETKEIVAYFSLKTGMIATNESHLFIISEFDSIPGIELANFAVNSQYKEAHSEFIGIGKIVFIDFILPIVKEVSKSVGVQHLYIFALPYRSLIAYYKTLNFERLSLSEELSLHRRIRPRYDKNCIFMTQKLNFDDCI